MTKFLVLIILVGAGTLSYETEIRASLLNLVGIVKTVVDEIADSLCDEGDQCRRNDTLPIPSINDMNTNPNDKPSILDNHEYKKDEPYDPYLDTWPESPNSDKKDEPYDPFEDTPADIPSNNNSKGQRISYPPRATPAPPTVPNNKKVPWSDFMKQYSN